MKKIFFLLSIFLLFFPFCSAHAWEELNQIFKCEQPAKISIGEVKETKDGFYFSVFVSNNSLTATKECAPWRNKIQNSKIVLFNGNEENLFEVLVEPEKQTIKIDEESAFKITVKRIKPVYYETLLDFRFFSDQINLVKPIFVKIPNDVSSKKAGVFLGEDFPIVFASATEPDEITFQRGKEGEFKLFLRNASKIDLHNVKLKIIESDFEVEIFPEEFEEMKANEIRSFTISAKETTDKPVGQYKILFEITAEEFPYSLTKNIWITVVLEDLFVYLFAGIIILLIALVLFRYKKFFSAKN